MSSPDQYFLRWRGRQSGPFTLSVIEQKLDEHGIGLSCEVKCEGRWVTLEQFLSDQQRKREANAQPIRIPLPASQITGGAVPVPPVQTLPPANALPPTQSVKGLVAETSVAISPLTVSKRRIVFAMLGIFLGFLGVHNFYAGYRRIGILQLVLTGLGVLLGFNLIVTWVWALVEVLFVHTDPRGAPLA